MYKAFDAFLTSNHLVSNGDGVLVALSGGPDSVALLHLLHALSTRLGINLFAAHLDHAIRKESAEDACFVARKCALLGIPLSVERRDIPEISRISRQGLEEAGREQRRQFLLRKPPGCEDVPLSLLATIAVIRRKPFCTVYCGGADSPGWLP
jgi:tRNA(Ile)-lysidine synthase